VEEVKTTTKYDDLITNFTNVVNNIATAAEGGRHARSLMDINERMNTLYEQLRKEEIPEEVVGKLREMVGRLEARDSFGATKALNEMSKHWGVIASASMTGLQRLARAIAQ